MLCIDPDFVFLNSLMIDKTEEEKLKWIYETIDCVEYYLDIFPVRSLSFFFNDKIGDEVFFVTFSL